MSGTNSRRNSREITSYRGGNGNASSNFAYGNTAGIYCFDANPIPTNNYNYNGNGGGGGGSNRITITNINGNGRLNVSGSRLSMTSMKSSLPNQSQSQSQSRSRSSQRTTGGAQLHPNDYKMVQYFNSLPTKFTMGGGRKSHTR
jgi:hypothetical protein